MKIIQEASYASTGFSMLLHSVHYKRGEEVPYKQIRVLSSAVASEKI